MKFNKIKRFKEKLEKIKKLEEFPKKQARLEALLQYILLFLEKKKADNQYNEIEEELKEAFKLRYMVTMASSFHFKMNHEVFDKKVSIVTDVLRKMKKIEMGIL